MKCVAASFYFFITQTVTKHEYIIIIVTKEFPMTSIRSFFDSKSYVAKQLSDCR